jgi:hypothetical protein
VATQRRFPGSQESDEHILGPASVPTTCRGLWWEPDMCPTPQNTPTKRDFGGASEQPHLLLPGVTASF